ncbi:penicillin-binding protein [Nocardia sp. SYP-A9097]|uniref:penicillin-binding transpeptidase domain-containing protein n=1 Tax=Nocardia sp. SYP-A9097 TaxID=2663237 RepID=UPI00129AA1D3|nr:penicillin-binding transpeptidase domain-containing protein [Nocardia sp. SYP-A9097]MRH86424.1 penicillin-binding protein [Nocardia sp. SYP-A9097]
MRTGTRLLGMVVASGLALTACSGDKTADRMQEAANNFADALNRDDIAAAAAATTDGKPATDTLTGLYDGLGKDVKFQVDKVEKADGGGTFTLAADWRLGKDGHNRWTYSTTGRLDDTADGWKVHWNPATVAPGLDIGPLSYSAVDPTPAARILDSTGGEFMTQQIVTLVNLAPGADTAAVAALLHQVAADITAASLNSELTAAQGKSITAVTLRAADIAPIQDALTALPNVTLAPQTRLLTTDRALTSPTWSGLADLWQQDTDAAAGWAVRAQGTDGTQRVGGPDAKPVNDIRTTLDPALQRAAEAALAPIPQAATIIALQPSSGNVLAIAQNAPADAQGPIALTGLYPPGSTFKTVTVSAALQSGAVTPDTVLPCPGTENIEGRQIPNDNNFDLGSVPLHTAFAKSCNTTMGRLAVNLPPDGLTNAASQLGLGLDYVTPALTTVTGKVPVADTPALRVEEGIGQGKVTATPFGMALVAAALAHGAPPNPILVQGRPGTPDHAAAPLPAGTADQIKAMMRETVTSGTATQLADIPGLLGKTGTAEFIDDKHAHGWFVGIEDDLAFAVFINDAGSSTPAVDAAGRLLRAH